MTTRFRIPLMAAALVGLATLGMGRTAEAAFTLTLSQAGYTDLVITDGGSGDQSPVNKTIAYDTSFFDTPGNPFLYGTFQISITAKSNQPGTPALGKMEEAVLTVTNMSGSSGPKTLNITLNDTGFALPSGSPLLLGGSLGGPSSWPVNDQNALLTLVSTLTSNGDPTPTREYTTNSLNVGDPPLVPDPSTDLVLATRTGSTYDLKQVVSVTLSNNSTAAFTAATSVTAAAVPEPSNIVMAGVGVVLSLGALRRRGRA